jgi:hypothetical protein
MSEAEERAVDIRARLHQDMHTTAVTNGVAVNQDTASLLDALCSDAMFQIEHLLVEIEALHIKARAQRPPTDLGWPRD